MSRPGDQKLNRRPLFTGSAILLVCAAFVAVAGCGSGAGASKLITPGTLPSPVGTASPTPQPISTPTPTPEVPLTPAVTLADLSRGAAWEYVTFPGTVSSGFSRPGPVPSGRKYRVLTYPGSPLTMGAGCAATDTDIPGALIRLSCKTTSAGSAGSAGTPSSTFSYHYDGTYRQDSATRDIYLLRLPSGERLDIPAKVLPGTWGLGTEIKSSFIVSGDVKAEYTLTVNGSEILETLIGKRASWLTNISIRTPGPEGKGHIQTIKQWFDPASGNYLQEMSRDTTMVLNDLTLVEIADDEKISAYKITPP